MRVFWIWLMAAALAAPATAGADYFAYTTESGTLAFTDDLKQVPKRYREKATQHEDKALEEYSRLSIAQPGAGAVALKTSIDLAALEAEERKRARERQLAEQQAGGQIGLEVGGGVRLNVDPDDEEPIFVERSRYTHPDGSYISRNGFIRPHTVIMKGDKPLIYIDERPIHGSGSKRAEDDSIVKDVLEIPGDLLDVLF